MTRLKLLWTLRIILEQIKPQSSHNLIYGYIFANLHCVPVLKSLKVEKETKRQFHARFPPKTKHTEKQQASYKNCTAKWYRGRNA